MDVLAACGQAGFVGEELLLDECVEARVLPRGGDGWRLLRLRREGEDREEGGGEEKRHSGIPLGSKVFRPLK